VTDDEQTEYDKDKDVRERCNEEMYHGKRHTPHWHKSFTKWCDGKVAR
jgi:hypothetical protein